MGGAVTGAPFARLFDHFLNNVITNKFEIALGCLICRFDMAENPKKKRLAVYDFICSLRVKDRIPKGLRSRVV